MQNQWNRKINSSKDPTHKGANVMSQQIKVINNQKNKLNC